MTLKMAVGSLRPPCICGHQEEYPCLMQYVRRTQISSFLREIVTLSSRQRSRIVLILVFSVGRSSAQINVSSTIVFAHRRPVIILSEWQHHSSDEALRPMGACCRSDHGRRGRKCLQANEIPALLCGMLFKENEIELALETRIVVNKFLEMHDGGGAIPPGRTSPLKTVVVSTASAQTTCARALSRHLQKYKCCSWSGTLSIPEAL